MAHGARNALGGVLALALLLTVFQSLGIAPAVPAAGTELISFHIPGDLPVTDPTSPVWDRAIGLKLPLSAQIAVPPILSYPTVSSLEARSLNNGTHIALRLSWADGTKNNATTRLQEFRDAVAVQVGAQGQLPYLCMGSANVRMNILQWKADWQADIEEGFRDLEDAFPNFWVDYYPYAIGEPPYEVPEDFPDEAQTYLVGYEVGNPFSQPLKVTAVEDAVAHGFSTITTQASQDAIGRGVWEDGRWSVVIARRLDTGDPFDNPVGRYTILAFAVWDGGNLDRGSRKSTTNWVPLVLRLPKTPEIDPLTASLLILVAAAVIVALFRRAEKKERREPTEGSPEKSPTEPGGP